MLKCFSNLPLARGPVQRHDVRLPLHGALGVPGPRHQRAAGGRRSDGEGWLRGPRLDRRRPRVRPPGEPDQPGQALPGRACAALVRARPGPGSGPLQGDEPPPGQQDPPAKVPLLPRPQCTVTHTQEAGNTPTHVHTRQTHGHGGGRGVKWKMWRRAESVTDKLFLLFFSYQWREGGQDWGETGRDEGVRRKMLIGVVETWRTGGGK